MTVSSTKGLAGALTRYRVMAYVTGVLLAFMTVVGLPYKYIFDGDAGWYTVGWMLHGWVYIAYVAISLDLVVRLRWHLGRAIAVLLAGTIPFMSFVAERKVRIEVESHLTDAGAPTESAQAVSPGA